MTSTVQLNDTLTWAIYNLQQNTSESSLHLTYETSFLRFDTSRIYPWVCKTVQPELDKNNLKRNYLLEAKHMTVRLHLCVCPTLCAGHMIDQEYKPNEVVGVFGLRLGAVCQFPAAFEWAEVQAVSWSGLSEPTVGSVAGRLVTKQQVLIVFIDVNWNFCFHKSWSSLSFEPGWKVLNKIQLMNYWKWQKVEQTWNFQAVLVVYDEIFLLWLQLP